MSSAIEQEFAKLAALGDLDWAVRVDKDDLVKCWHYELLMWPPNGMFVVRDILDILRELQKNKKNKYTSWEGVFPSPCMEGGIAVFRRGIGRGNQPQMRFYHSNAGTLLFDPDGGMCLGVMFQDYLWEQKLAGLPDALLYTEVKNDAQKDLGLKYDGFVVLKNTEDFPRCMAIEMRNALESLGWTIVASKGFKPPEDTRTLVPRSQPFTGKFFSLGEEGTLELDELEFLRKREAIIDGLVVAAGSAVMRTLPDPRLTEVLRIVRGYLFPSGAQPPRSGASWPKGLEPWQRRIAYAWLEKVETPVFRSRFFHISNRKNVYRHWLECARAEEQQREEEDPKEL